MATRFTLRQIEYFVAVGETGSVALAAERLAVSSPSISAALAHLEAVFGLSLFIRHHAQGMAMTAEGRRFLADARRLLAGAAELHGAAASMAQDVRGPLAVGCLIVVAPLILPALRRGFSAAHPAVELSARTGHQAALIEDLRAARINVALTYDLGLPADIGFTPLATLPPHALVAADHPLAGRTDVTLADLAPLPLLLLDLPLSRDYLLGLFAQAGLTPRIAERVPDYDLLRAMVANGFGYGLANVRRRSDLSPDGRPLASVRIAGGARPVLLGLASARQGARPRVLAVFEAYCRAHVTDSAIPGMAPAQPAS